MRLLLNHNEHTAPLPETQKGFDCFFTDDQTLATFLALLLIVKHYER